MCHMGRLTMRLTECRTCIVSQAADLLLYLLVCSALLILQVQQLRCDVSRLQEQLQTMQGDLTGKESIILCLQEGEGRLTGRVTDLSGQVEGLRQELAGSSCEVVRLTSALTAAEEAHALALQVQYCQLLSVSQ